MFQLTPVVKQLLIINVIFFIAGQMGLNETFALYYFDSENFRIWQIVTHFFMHAGLFHIFFNMYALVLFGAHLERLWGGKRFLFYYLFCALGAAVLHTAFNYYQFSQLDDLILAFQASPDPTTFIRFFNKIPDYFLTSEGVAYIDQMESAFRKSIQPEMVDGALNLMNEIVDGQKGIPVVGASGAIYGLLVAFGLLFPSVELMLIFLPIPIKAKFFIPVMIIIEFFLGVNQFSWDNIAHFAHLGGALFGVILILFWTKFDQSYRSR